MTDRRQPWADMTPDQWEEYNERQVKPRGGDLARASTPGFDWLGRPLDPVVEAQRSLSVYECDDCQGGLTVRYCPIHGLHGTAPR